MLEKRLGIPPELVGTHLELSARDLCKEGNTKQIESQRRVLPSGQALTLESIQAGLDLAPLHTCTLYNGRIQVKYSDFEGGLAAKMPRGLPPEELQDTHTDWGRSSLDQPVCRITVRSSPGSPRSAFRGIQRRIKARSEAPVTAASPCK